MLSPSIFIEGIAEYSTEMIVLCSQKWEVDAKRNSVGLYEAHKNFVNSLLQNFKVFIKAFY